MRLLLCTKPDLTSVITLNTLLARLGRHDVHVLVSTATPAPTNAPEAEQMKFFERDLPSDLLFPLIDQTRPAAPRWHTLEGLKRQYGVTIEYTNSLANPMTLAGIAGFQPDLILSVGFNLVFGPEILRIPALGTVNIHPGFLPRYAGPRALLRALIDGEQRIGCTLHLADAGITTGPILAEDSVPVTPDRSLHSYKLESYLIGAQLFLDVLEAVDRGRPLTGVPQPAVQPAQAATRAEQFAKLRERGIPVVKPADYVRLVQRFVPAGAAAPLAALLPLWARSAA